jgi:hypothetical protein
VGAGPKDTISDGNIGWESKGGIRSIESYKQAPTLQVNCAGLPLGSAFSCSCLFLLPSSRKTRSALAIALTRLSGYQYALLETLLEKLLVVLAKITEHPEIRTVPMGYVHNLVMHFTLAPSFGILCGYG